MALNTFDIRARTIDHLGRGQIADAPTAVSELWKNAYDAYAKKVELKIYHEPNGTVAVISDDGCGMSLSDILEKWLVLGTDSKYKNLMNTDEDTLGLPARVKQGEKGIGRLSTAFLAPIVLLITRKKNADFVATLVDWRLFENPFLSIFDIQIPTEEFNNIDDINSKFTKLRKEIEINLGIGNDENSMRLNKAWLKFSTLTNVSKEDKSSYEKIEKSLRVQYDLTKYLPYFKEKKWNHKHGTNIILFETYDELSGLDAHNTKDELADDNINNFMSTLTGFVDPYDNPYDNPYNRQKINFIYRIQSIEKDTSKKILDYNDVFGQDDFNELEHRFIGEFTEDGDFIGEVVAFSENMGKFKYRPKDTSAKELREIGKFTLSIGSFEGEPRNSTLTKDKVLELNIRGEKFGGIYVYRDGLRVLPYGRPDSDFLEIEKRRSFNAGAHFFSYRRTFGRIAITRENNPELKDKAGREGFISNKQFRSFRKILIELLGVLANRYFGRASDLRKSHLAQVLEDKLEKEAQQAEELRLKRRSEFRKTIRSQTKLLVEKSTEINAISNEIKILSNASNDALAKRISDKIKTLTYQINSFSTPTPPENLGNFEIEWRDYRDRLDYIINQIKDAQNYIINYCSHNKSNYDILQDNLALYDAEIKRIEDKISEVIRSYSSRIIDNLTKENKDFREYFVKTYSENKNTSYALFNIANALQSANERSENIEYNLKTIEAGTNLKNIFEYSENQREKIKNELDDIRAVAQIGITVEIIGHELSALEAGVKNSLSRLPKDVKATDAYNDSIKSLNALTERLRFLAPMKIAGYQPRERIKGDKIGEYISQFFATSLEYHNIKLLIDDNFKNIAFEGRPSRIYPAIINIVNNAIYWVRNVEEPKISITFRNGYIIIANNGPSIDAEDINHLFELFFTRRKEGRGVGLYLAMVNLATEGQVLSYVTDKNKMIYPNGANFSIKLKGVI